MRPRWAFYLGLTVLLYGVMVGVSYAGNAGAYAPAADAVDWLGAMLWRLMKVGVIGLGVYGVIQVASRNFIGGIIELSMAIVVALLVFVVLPKQVELGDAAGATLDSVRQTPAPVSEVMDVPTLP